MSLKAQILEDIKLAMKAREQAKLTTLRMLSAAIKQKEVDERVELDDAAVLAIIEKQIKQRNEAAIQFEQGGRPESAELRKPKQLFWLPIFPPSCLKPRLWLKFRQLFKPWVPPARKTWAK